MFYVIRNDTVEVLFREPTLAIADTAHDVWQEENYPIWNEELVNFVNEQGEECPSCTFSEKND